MKQICALIAFLIVINSAFSEKQEVRIGVIQPLTGSASAYGIDAQRIFGLIAPRMNAAELELVHSNISDTVLAMSPGDGMIAIQDRKFFGQKPCAQIDTVESRRRHSHSRQTKKLASSA